MTTSKQPRKISWPRVISTIVAAGAASLTVLATGNEVLTPKQREAAKAALPIITALAGMNVVTAVSTLFVNPFHRRPRVVKMDEEAK